MSSLRFLYLLRGAECDAATLRRALEGTAKKRGSLDVLEHTPEILKEIQESAHLRNLWYKYRREYDYVKDISFDYACATFLKI